MSDTKFNWQGDEDDALCQHGNYLLRAECLEHNCYWWAVTICLGKEQYLALLWTMATWALCPKPKRRQNK